MLIDASGYQTEGASVRGHAPVGPGPVGSRADWLPTGPLGLKGAEHEGVRAKPQMPRGGTVDQKFMSTLVSREMNR